MRGAAADEFEDDEIYEYVDEDGEGYGDGEDELDRYVIL